MQPQTDKQRGKRAGALTARKGLVGGTAQGSTYCRKNWTTALVSTEHRASELSHQCRMYRGSARCLGWWKVQRNEGPNVQQNRYRGAPARQIGVHECSRSLQVNVKNIRTPSFPSQQLGRGGVCYEVRTFSRLIGQLVICQRIADSFPTRSSCS